MKSFLNKLVASVAGAVLLGLGFVMAAFGISVVAILAMFALAAAGLGLIASPLIAVLQPADGVGKDNGNATPAT